MDEKFLPEGGQWRDVFLAAEDAVVRLACEVAVLEDRAIVHALAGF